MWTKVAFYVVPVLLICLSCSSSKKDLTEINLKEAVASSERRNAEDYCKSLSYVKLETDDDVLSGRLLTCSHLTPSLLTKDTPCISSPIPGVLEKLRSSRARAEGHSAYQRGDVE